jgi:hypothetical protein
VRSPWSSPDPRGTGTGSAFAPHAAAADADDAPPLAHDVRAGLITVAVTVLVGAPVGLLWAALAPPVEVVVSADGVRLVDRDSSAFIASDGYFVAAVLLAGVVGGALAWRLGSRHGPAVVPGLAVGGLLAAYIAMAVGGLVDDVALAELVEAGVQGRRELPARLRSRSALLVWPAASLLTFLVLVLRRPRDVSSGARERDRAREPVSR